MDTPLPNRIFKTISILTCVVFSVGLISFALIGTSSRYIQDDFCYAYMLRGDNFFLTQYNAYMSATTFSGNRFSLTLGMGLSELAGQSSVPVLPGLLLFAWLIGLYFLTRRVSQQSTWLYLNRLEALIFSEALILFTLSIAPNWIQSFFWRAGMFPYFAPLVTGTYLLLMIMIAGRDAKWRPLVLVGIFLLAVLTGGFSETAVSVEIVLLGFIFCTACLNGSVRRNLALPAGVAFLGATAAMALTIASPVNAERLRFSYGTSASLQSTLLNSLDGGIYFYIFTAYRPTLLYASALIFFSLFGLIHSWLREKPPLSPKQYVIGLFASILVAYALTTSAMAPSFYAQSSYPGKRALMIPGFISMLLAASVGGLTGNFLSRWRKERWFSIPVTLAGAGTACINALWLAGMSEHFYPPAYPEMRAYLMNLNPAFPVIVIVLSVVVFGGISVKYKPQAALALVMLIYLIQPVLMSARILHEYPILQRRADLWDTRQTQILQARDSGERELTVRALDSLAGLTDLSDNPGYWVNNCTAAYYGVKSIKGVQPVLNPEPLINP